LLLAGVFLRGVSLSGILLLAGAFLCGVSLSGTLLLAGASHISRKVFGPWKLRQHGT
jgi:hypothetical protein